MAGPGNILIKVGADTAAAVSNLGKVDKALGDTMTTGEKMHAGLSKAALPAAAALGAIGVAAVGAAKAAMEDAAAQDHLRGMLERSTGATEEQVKQTEDWISSISQATGVADDKLRPALEKIAVATGDVASAQGYLSQAMDISAATGKDLDTVSAAIAKGYTGQTAALSKLVPGLSDAAKSSKDFSVIMDELGQKTGGAMADQADTAAGSMARLSNTTAELQESLGMALLPVIEAVVPILQQMAVFASENTGAIKVLVGVVAALAAGILVANGVMKAYAAVQAVVKIATAAWTAAQWLLNAALSANPIGLVVVALAALATGLVIAYTKSETFRNIVNAAFAAVVQSVKPLVAAFELLVDAARFAFNWITEHWKVALLGLGPIGVAIALLASNWDKVTSAAQAAMSAITGAIGAVSGAIYGLINAVESLIGALSRIKVPHINLPGPFSMPMAAAPAFAGATPFGSSRSSSRATAGGTTIQVFGAVDPEGTARAIRRILSNHERRQGR